MSKERDSGIEILRIFAILMVIGVHVFLYGGYYDCAIQEGGIIGENAKYFQLFFRPAVNIFVIITGYFMARKPFDLSKSYKSLLTTYLTLYFYSVVLSLLVLYLGPESYTVGGKVTPVWKIVVSMIFPVFSQQWYFLTDYVLLCFMAPFINIILQKITKKQYQGVLVFLTMVLSIWQMVSAVDAIGDVIRSYGYEGMVEGKNVFSFLYIYMIGGYIGMYGKERKYPHIIYFLGIFFFAWVNYYILENASQVFQYEELSKYYSNPLVILSSVCALLFFKDLHFHSKIINAFASTTIGVYAIHEFEFTRKWLWTLFQFHKYDCSNLQINVIRIVCIILVIFLVCALVELLRQQFFRMVGSVFFKKKKDL